MLKRSRPEAIYSLIDELPLQKGIQSDKGLDVAPPSKKLGVHQSEHNYLAG